MGQEEFLQELYWQRDYQNIDSLYVSCLADRFTYRQMNNPNSLLSKNGIEICREFEKATGNPFYYYLANFQKNLTTCPLCGENWQQNENNKIVDFKCHKCRLVTDKE
jgi:predicted  nucleic acid-binding Zn ribbon protein